MHEANQLVPSDKVIQSIISAQVPVRLVLDGAINCPFEM